MMEMKENEDQRVICFTEVHVNKIIAFRIYTIESDINVMRPSMSQVQEDKEVKVENQVVKAKMEKMGSLVNIFNK